MTKFYWVNKDDPNFSLQRATVTTSTSRWSCRCTGGCWTKAWRSGAHIPETKWQSATVTTLDARIPEHIQRICKRDPFSGKVVTGGIVTVRDSSWLMSWTVNRQPHFKQQPSDQVVVWVYLLFVDVPGDRPDVLPEVFNSTYDVRKLLAATVPRCCTSPGPGNWRWGDTTSVMNPWSRRNAHGRLLSVYVRSELRRAGHAGHAAR